MAWEKQRRQPGGFPLLRNFSKAAEALIQRSASLKSSWSLVCRRIVYYSLGSSGAGVHPGIASDAGAKPSNADSVNRRNDERTLVLANVIFSAVR